MHLIRQHLGAIKDMKKRVLSLSNLTTQQVPILQMPIPNEMYFQL